MIGPKSWDEDYFGGERNEETVERFEVYIKDGYFLNFVRDFQCIEDARELAREILEDGQEPVIQDDFGRKYEVDL